MDIMSSLFWCVLGIAGGAVVTFVNNKRKRLTRKMFTVNLISEKVSSINGLKIEYNSQPIKNLYSSTIQIKNTGNTTINSVDIPKKRPLSIHTDGIFIIDKLNMQLPNPNNENDIHVIFDKSEKGTSSSANIDFEYISPKQVIAVTLLHTGKISLGKWKIKDGKVFDSNEILDEIDYPNHATSLVPKLFYPIAALTIVGIIMLIFSYINFSKDLNSSLQDIHNQTSELNSYNDRNSIYINELNNKIQDLEYELQAIKEHLNEQTISSQP